MMNKQFQRRIENSTCEYQDREGSPTGDKQFQRRIENFTCGNCGAFVKGNGYTNHCPECLWSRHVDVNPGDRGETCRGMMEPVAVTQKRGTYILHHRCTKCAVKRRNKTSAVDDFDAILRVVAESR